MTLENPEKPKPESAKGIELKEKIRLAVALKYLRNLSDAQIAEHFHLSPYTVADWKRRPEWLQEMKTIAEKQVSETCNEFLAMTPYARQVLLDLLKEESAAIRLKAAQFICGVPLKSIIG